MARLLLLLAVVLASANGKMIDEKLKFDVVSSRSVEEPPSIKVTFANGEQDEMDLTHFKMNAKSEARCSYTGQLRSDSSSSVAVTGCLNKPGDRMEVTLISKSNINKMFAVDFDGNAEVIENPFEGGKQTSVRRTDRKDEGWQQKGGQTGDELVNADEEKAVQRAPVRSIPTKLKATLQLGYEDGLKSALESEGTNFDDWIAEAFPHMQAHFRHSESLGTQVEFEVLEGSLYEQGATWYADDNIMDAKAASLASIQSSGIVPDTFSWWSNSGSGGVAGIAWVGTLCNSNGYGTNLNEKQGSAAGSGFVWAHELGHNFGMLHDFDEEHGGTGTPFEAPQSPCDGTGIMSYGSYSYDQWSVCSKQDWENHFNGLNWGAWCLEDISSGDTGTETTQAPTGNCFDVKTVTQAWGVEVTWSIDCKDESCATCTNKQDYGDYSEYTQQCCMPEDKEEFSIYCVDAYGDGWHGGYLEINGEKYCENFDSGFSATDSLSTGDETPVTTEAPCADELATRKCEKRKSKGKCSKKGTQRKCAMTCGLCGGESSTAAPTDAPTAAPPAEFECGIKPAGIVGGNEVSPYSIPWQVGIVSVGGTDPWCGGTLISPTHVLTAAHCMGGNFEVIVGEHDITDSEDGTRHTVSSAISHPQYVEGSWTATTDYDYAIVTLDTPVELGTRAVPACLPDPNEFGGGDLNSATMTVSGWGHQEFGGQGPNELHSVDVPGISNSQCQTDYPEEQISDAMLCAGAPEGGIDACQGDSGGPLTYTNGAPAKAYVVGVVSWGYGCAAAGYPGVYARVTHVMDWITELTGLTPA